MYLFKRVADDVSGLTLRKKVSRMLQSITSMIAVIPVYWMLKESHVELLPYL